jgi:hypothetical protein
MTKFKNSDRKDQSALLIDDARLDAVVGGALADHLSAQLRLAYLPVGGWDMPDVWTHPTLGQVVPPR